MITINADMKIFKGSTIFMIVAVVLLVVYYLALHHKNNNKNAEVPPVSNTDTVKTETKNDAARADTTISIEYLTGKFNPAKDKSFTECDLEYANREGIYLQEETYKAFIKMFYAAKNDGVTLKIISGTRNFAYQKSIWEQKWNGSRLVDGKNLATTVKDPVERASIILKYSSMPGTSRHHWGTDIDLNSMENKYFETPAGKKIYDWLCNNASKYGFCQPFSTLGEKRKDGYQEEKWHWSYLPLAKTFLKEYQKKVTYDHITGFAGSQTARELKVIDNYVMSINKDCE